jgi:glycosyltransferase involved in cell wall biosynthesis
MTSNSIHVSVIMAVKNESKYIFEAVQSILSQDGINFELIVIDDNSNDNTYEIVHNKFSSTKNFSLFKSPGTGKVAAFNFGLSMAKGDFICLFAGDDIMPSNSLLQRYKALSDISADQPVAGLSKIKILSDDKTLNGKIVPRRKGHGSLSGQSPLMNRMATELLFPIPEILPNEDTWLEIAFSDTKLIKLIHSDIICCNWRMHAGNSVGLKIPYNEYKPKLVLRRSAYGIFLNQFIYKLPKNEQRALNGKVKGIKCYEKEDLIGLLLTDTDFMWKIRMISSINSFFYTITTKFKSALTGW